MSTKTSGMSERRLHGHQSTRNDRESPSCRLEINFVDFLRRRSYRLKGRAEFRDPGDEVFRMAARLAARDQRTRIPREPCRVHVDRVRPVLSPAYTFGGKDEKGEAESSALASGLR